MRSRLLIGGLLASVMIVPALAQSSPPAASPTPSSPPAASGSVSTTQSSQWRASKLIGLNVYNEQNEKLGDISELIVDKSGKIDGVVIGVGGFLGIGQRDIKVEMSKLKFVDEPVRTSATGASTTGAAGSPANRATTGASSTAAASSGHKWYPDHVVLSGASKEQLKNMPEFKY